MGKYLGGEVWRESVVIKSSSSVNILFPLPALNHLPGLLELGLAKSRVQVQVNPSEQWRIISGQGINVSLP